MAQEDGLFVDPESPAGKEYAIPLEEARREAAGGEPGKDSAGGPPAAAPRFGVGIPPKGSGGSGRGRGGKPGREDQREKGARGKGSTTGGLSEGPGSGGPDGGPNASVESAASGGSTALTTGGVVLLLLALGAGLGLGLRRLSHQSGS